MDGYKNGCSRRPISLVYQTPCNYGPAGNFQKVFYGTDERLQKNLYPPQPICPYTHYMAGKPYTLEEIEAQFCGLAALVAVSHGITGKIIIHKSRLPGDIRLQLDLEGDPQTVAEAAGLLAACSK